MVERDLLIVDEILLPPLLPISMSLDFSSATISLAWSKHIHTYIHIYAYIHTYQHTMHTYRLTVYTLHTYIHINHTPIYKYTYTYIHRYSSSLWTRWRTPFRHPEWTSTHSKVSCESLAISCKDPHEAAKWNKKRVGWPMHVCMLIYVYYINLFMYVCMYVCMYACTYLYMHVCINE